MPGAACSRGRRCTVGPTARAAAWSPSPAAPRPHPPRTSLRLADQRTAHLSLRGVDGCLLSGPTDVERKNINSLKLEEGKVGLAEVASSCLADLAPGP